MRQRRWGRIINIASDTVSLLVPNFVHYITSKAGVIGFTRSLATEFGEHGVTVNAIAPGLTRTPGTLADKEIPGGMSKEALFDMMANMQSIKRGEKVVRSGRRDIVSRQRGRGLHHRADALRQRRPHAHDVTFMFCFQRQMYP